MNRATVGPRVRGRNGIDAVAVRRRPRESHEVQGWFAIPVVEAEAIAPATPPASVERPPRAEATFPDVVESDPGPSRPTCRSILAEWPDFWRERWGLRANALEEEGLSWREAEGRAFLEVWNERKRSGPVDRN